MLLSNKQPKHQFGNKSQWNEAITGVTNGNNVHFTQLGGLSLPPALENLTKTQRDGRLLHECLCSARKNMSGQQLQM